MAKLCQYIFCHMAEIWPKFFEKQSISPYTFLSGPAQRGKSNLQVLLLSKSQMHKLWAIHPKGFGTRAVTGMAPPRTVTQEWLSLFAISPNPLRSQSGRSYDPTALL